jgi:hypothetical protein
MHKLVVSIATALCAPAAVALAPTKIVDANELMWEFFAKHPLPR